MPRLRQHAVLAHIHAGMGFLIEALAVDVDINLPGLTPRAIRDGAGRKGAWIVRVRQNVAVVGQVLIDAPNVATGRLAQGYAVPLVVRIGHTTVQRRAVKLFEHGGIAAGAAAGEQYVAGLEVGQLAVSAPGGHARYAPVHVHFQIGDVRFGGDADAPGVQQLQHRRLKGSIHRRAAFRTPLVTRDQIGLVALTFHRMFR